MTSPDLSLALVVASYAIIAALIFRTLAKRWRSRFGRMSRGESVMIGIMAIIVPAGLLIIVTEHPAINAWLNKEWGE